MKSVFLAFGLFACLFLLSCKSEDAPRPNILFAIADDASYPHMGAYGTDWVVTPAFDFVAKNGLLFQKAYTTNAKCSPSRATILTGRNSWLLEEACNHMPYFPEKFKTFVEALPAAGYYVGHTAKGWAPGVAEMKGAPRELIGPAFNEFVTEPPAGFMSSNDYKKNFAAFLDSVPDDAPWFFWYGAHEPHRAYAFGAGLTETKSLGEIDVPPYWPDNDTVRTDMLDYAFEIEYFDNHLDSILKILMNEDLLENTLIVVTADNGMPFPRVKGQVYENDHHLPLAMMWPAGIEKPGRSVSEFVSFSDFAPTFLELAGLSIEQAEMQPMSGTSLHKILEGKPDSNPRDHIIVGKERHDMGRPNDEGFPVRAIIKGDYMFSLNFKPDRWPAGNPETGYLNCDGSPTKTSILELYRSGLSDTFWKLSFGKRPEEELYHIKDDPYCLYNLVDDTDLTQVKAQLKEQLYAQLTAEGDPRMLGSGDLFDQYPAASDAVNYYSRWLSGERPPTGWVNEGDFEQLDSLIK